LITSVRDQTHGKSILKQKELDSIKIFAI
jgi:hypothetical protein